MIVLNLHTKNFFKFEDESIFSKANYMVSYYVIDTQTTFGPLFFRIKKKF
jgi:hypothetical protein